MSIVYVGTGVEICECERHSIAVLAPNPTGGEKVCKARSRARQMSAAYVGTGVEICECERHSIAVLAPNPTGGEKVCKARSRAKQMSAAYVGTQVEICECERHSIVGFSASLSAEVGKHQVYGIFPHNRIGVLVNPSCRK